MGLCFTSQWQAALGWKFSWSSNMSALLTLIIRTNSVFPKWSIFQVRWYMCTQVSLMSRRYLGLLRSCMLTLSKRAHDHCGGRSAPRLRGITWQQCLWIRCQRRRCAVWPCLKCVYLCENDPGLCHVKRSGNKRGYCTYRKTHKRAQQSENIRGLYSMLSEQTLNIKNKPIKETNYLTTVTVMY